LPVAKARITAANLSLFSAYLFFCFLMLRIVLQYIPAGTDTAFLGIKQEYVELPYYLPAFYIHVFTALFALPAGFTQFSRYLLKNYPAIHRLNGKVYVLSILLLGAPSGFIIGLYANGGIWSRISFCLLAVLWALFTSIAWKKAIQKQFKQHKAFIYRSFALTLSAITLRAWKYGLITLFHMRPMDTYRIIAWLGWTLNLLIAEIIIYKQSTK
jgi:hypothetical protein